MGLPKSRHAYRDIEKVLNTALEKGGVRLRCPTAGKAVYWRQRAYKLRTILWKDGPTPYDQMELTLDGEYVVIAFKEQPELTDLQGRKVQKLEESDVDDDLLETALNLNLEVKQ